MTSIEIAHKSGKTKIEGRVYVDATGDCDLTYLLGRDYVQGRMQDGKTQPLTMNFKICNVNLEKVKEYIRANPEQFPCLKGDAGVIEKAPRLSMGGYIDLLKRAIAEKRVSFLREDVLFFETNTKGELIVNTTRVLDVDPTDPVDLTRAEILGRRQAMELFQLLKKEVGGFEDAILEYTGPFIGVRSSRQIVGKHTFSAQDVLNGTEFPDTVAYGGYPIDIHCPDGLAKEEEREARFTSGKVYRIPLSCMYGEVRNLITVGRCISATFEAQAAIRVSPIAGAIGHAGGVAASVCASSGTDIQDVDIQVVKDILREQDAYMESSF
ncbi:MAG: FAD-dependent oxidoreductase [Lachnospiraceae bacterium]|nr:FAD-dependent oxidoreductase [Lachnospiraceae bacterium]